MLSLVCALTRAWQMLSVLTAEEIGLLAETLSDEAPTPAAQTVAAEPGLKQKRQKIWNDTYCAKKMGATITVNRENISDVSPLVDTRTLQRLARSGSLLCRVPCTRCKSTCGKCAKGTEGHPLTWHTVRARVLEQWPSDLSTITVEGGDMDHV